jgi:hypothetical protein
MAICEIDGGNFVVPVCTKSKNMKNKRDLIEEIKEIKARTEYNSRYDLTQRLFDLDHALYEFKSYNGDYNQELLKYIPIATISCFESFFKSVVKELIDFGKPYSLNVSNFNQSKNVKLDFDIISAIQAKTLTVGEFVAHLLPYNNLEDINLNISTIIQDDFLGQLRKFKNIKDKDVSSIDFAPRFDEILKNVKRTFELRHIFCHEFATNFKIEKEEVISLFDDNKLFLEHTNSFIWTLRYPDGPYTTSEMLQVAGNELKNAELSLYDLIEKIKKINSSDTNLYSFDYDLFNKSIIKWKEFRDEYANCKASSFDGGSMSPVQLLTSKSSITKNLIAYLEKEFEIDLRINQLPSHWV